MSKTVRIRTTPNGDDSYLKVKVEQDFDFIEILSLKISQAEAYSRFCSDYGVVVGRVIVNNGFGVPNAKVSIFVPLTDEDEEDSEIKGLYPFKVIDDKDSEGIRYNLLQNDPNPQETCFTPVGTFPAKREVIDNDTVLDVYDKYYKFTTTTNDAGDFMLFGVPTGSHVLNVDVDLSDIGIASQRPYDYITEGESPKKFESPNKFKGDKDLDKLIQIKSFKKGVNVQPFWGDKDQCDIGITRVDVDLKKKLIPTAIFMGALFSDSEKNSINKNCRPRRDFGRICETDTGEGTVEMIRKTLDGKIERFDVEGGRVINEFGSWAYQIPMNLDVMITDEFGNLVPSEDPNKGLPTRAKVRFRVSKDVSGDEGRLRTTAKYLVPHNPSSPSDIDYSFDENTSDEHFRNFHWNKIYSVSNFIPRVQATCLPSVPNLPGVGCADNRNITGIKDVDNCVGRKNPHPFNRVDTDFNPLFTIICVILSIIVLIVFLINSTVIAFVNLIIKIINVILEAICEVVFAFAKTICGLVGKVTFGFFDSNKCKKAGCISGKYNDGECPCKTILDYVPCITFSCDSQDYAPGCNCSDLDQTNATVGSGDDDPDDVGNLQLGCWKSRTNIGDGKNIQHWTGLSYGGSNCGHPGHNTPSAGYTDCVSIKLAEALNTFEFDFYNDWVNGTLYTYLLKFKKAKRSKIKFCDTDCDSADSDNSCDKSYFVDTCVSGGNGRLDNKHTTSEAIDEGFIKMVTKKLPDGRIEETLYYAPYASNLSQKLFATELIHLGSVFDCDWQGIPKIQQFLVPTTYNRPAYTDEWLIKPNGDNTTIRTSCGMVSTGSNGSSGVFFDIDCLGLTVGQVNTGNGALSRCDNFKRQCEFGMNIDESQLSSTNTQLVKSDCYLNDNDLAQPFAGRVRDIFYQLNAGSGTTKLDSWLASGLPNSLNTGFGTSLPAIPASIGAEYKAFRGTGNGQPFWTPLNAKNSGYVQPLNSFYFYFGTMPGQTALELMNRKFFTTCEIPEVNDFAINLFFLENTSNSGVCDGQIQITVIGGEPNYTYNWTGPNGYTNPSSSIGDIVGLCAGNYTVTVTDANGGTSTASYTVNEPAPFTCSVTSTNSIITGGDGTITIRGFGGLSPYQYVINNGTAVTMGGSQKTLDKPAGTYIVTLTDDNGNGTSCTNPTTGVTITEPPALSIFGLENFTNTTCGDDNGTISLLLNSGSIGGTPPYSFSITGVTNPNSGMPQQVLFSNTSSKAVNLAPGTYTITVTDSGFNPTLSAGTQTDTTIVTILPSIEPTLNYVNSWYCWEYSNSQSQNIYPSFNITANGSFEIKATPKDLLNNPLTPVITELFVAGTTTAVFTTLLLPSAYDFVLTDVDGCNAETFATFIPGQGQVPPVAMRLEYSNSTDKYCWTTTKPDIKPRFQVWADGPFVIEWNGGASSQNFPSGVPYGTEVSITGFVDVTDTVFTLRETTTRAQSIVCSIDKTISYAGQIPSGVLNGVTSMSTPVDCGGTQIVGTATVAPSGGWSNYTYKWYNGINSQVGTTQSIQVPISACGEIWTCRITDDAGCKIIRTLVII